MSCPSNMRTFRYFAPSILEQRGFIFQLIGTILTFLVAGTLMSRTAEAGLRATLSGICIGVLFLMVRTAVQLETKAQRSQNAEIGVDENGLQITTPQGMVHNLRWDEIQSSEVSNGKLMMKWAGGELKFAAREVENGMELIQLIAARGKSTPDANSSNFIPLQPK